MGKNLIPHPFYDANGQGNPYVALGLTYTANVDGTLTVDGTATHDHFYTLVYYKLLW